jgi:uncharacterized repeat protein (TIGR01451 family)
MKIQSRRPWNTWLAGGSLGALSLLLGVGLFQLTTKAAPQTALITGEIERMTVTNPNDVWSGGTIVVGGQNVIIPRNLLIDFPANRLTLAQTLAAAPPSCVAVGESGLAIADTCNLGHQGGIATIAANRVDNGDVIAGDVFLQKGAEIISGQVTYIDYNMGFFRLDGVAGDPNLGVMVRLNDPTGAHSAQQGLGCGFGPNCSPDPRFTEDPVNYTQMFSTGYPLCIPSVLSRSFNDALDFNNNGNTTETLLAQASPDGAGDILCPDSNRPATDVSADSRRFAPIKLGDNLTVKGNFETVNGSRYLSAWGTRVSVALTTDPNRPDQPDYAYIDEMFIDAPGFQRNRIRDQFIGFVSGPTADVLIFTTHHDPTTNAMHEFPLGTSAGCDIAAGANTCTNVLGPHSYRIRHDAIFTAAGKNAKLDPCLQLRADSRFAARNPCPNGGTLAEEFSLMSPITHESHLLTGRKFADLNKAGGPTLRTLDFQGNEAANGQYLFPMGIGLGGIETPVFLEINIAALQTPFSFDGIPWNLDRRLSPGGCIGACESTPQPLDPFPVSGFDPRIQAANPPTGVVSDPNFTASPLSVANNRVLSFVDAAVNNFNGDATVLAWPPAPPAPQPITATPCLPDPAAPAPSCLPNTTRPSSITAAPAAPTNLTATAVTNSQIDLTWSASTTVGVTSYKVFRDGAAVARTSVSGTSFSDTGLATASTHSYTVAAIDAAGNQSAQTAPARATTNGTAPPPPTGADLVLSGTASPQPVAVGSLLTYSLQVVNQGPQAATSTTLADALPTGVTFGSAAASVGTCSAPAPGSQVVSCALGTLNAGATATVTIVVTPTAAGTLTNTPSVSSAVTDPNTANNSVTQTSTVSGGAGTGTSADLAVTHAPPTRARPNSLFQYGITATNSGPAAAHNVVVTDQLSVNETFAGATASQGTCAAPAAGTGLVTCTIGTVNPTATVTINITVTTSAAGNIIDTAQVSATEPDPNTANNTNTQTVRVH